MRAKCLWGPLIHREAMSQGYTQGRKLGRKTGKDSFVVSEPTDCCLY